MKNLKKVVFSAATIILALFISQKTGTAVDIQYLTPPGLSYPYGIVYDGVQTVYVASSRTGAIFAINTSSLEYEEYFIRGAPTYNDVYSLTLDDDGTLWFTERRFSKIGKFDLLTKTFKEFPTAGGPVYGILYNSFDGNVWFTDPPYLSKINIATEEITNYYVGLQPTFLSLDSSGNLWIADLGLYMEPYSGKIYKFDIGLNQVTLEVPGIERGLGIFVNGSLVFVAENAQPWQGNPNYQLDMNGTIVIYDISTGITTRVNSTIITDEGPFMVYVDSYGNVWFTDDSFHLGKIGYTDGNTFVENRTIYHAAGPFIFFMTQVKDEIWFSGKGSDFIGIVETGPFEFVHDLAVTNIISKTAVGQGYSLPVKVTVENEGVSLPETFNVSAYFGDYAIGTQTVSNLPSGHSATLLFPWDTGGTPYGNYCLSAHATPVPGETDTADNDRNDTWVLVTIPGDVNEDRVVNVLDAIMLSRNFGRPDLYPNGDINNDGYINVLDAILIMAHFGECW